jgi:hypothetical protein
MTGGDFAHLCDDYPGRITLERWTFPSAEGCEANLDHLCDPATGPGPARGLVVVSYLTSTSASVDAGILRGTTASPGDDRGREGLVYARWTDDAESSQPPVWTPLGGTMQAGASRYRHYGGYRNPDRDPTEGNLAVLVSIRFDGADHGRLRDWADLVIRALHTDPAPPAGLVSAQFHLADDGTTVANLAVWTSEADYDRALASGPPGIAQSDTPAWRAVVDFPGIVRNTVTRYADIATWREPSSHDPGMTTAAHPLR